MRGTCVMLAKSNARATLLLNARIPLLMQRADFGCRVYVCLYLVTRRTHTPEETLAEIAFAICAMVFGYI